MNDFGKYVGLAHSNAISTFGELGTLNDTINAAGAVANDVMANLLATYERNAPGSPETAALKKLTGETFDRAEASTRTGEMPDPKIAEIIRVGDIRASATPVRPGPKTAPGMAPPI